LEGFGLEEYKRGRLTKAALRRLLGYSTRDQLNGFLKAHAVVEDLPTAADLDELERPGFAKPRTHLIPVRAVTATVKNP
jgi:hypothetical protein